MKFHQFRQTSLQKDHILILHELQIFQVQMASKVITMAQEVIMLLTPVVYSLTSQQLVQVEMQILTMRLLLMQTTNAACTFVVIHAIVW